MPSLLGLLLPGMVAPDRLLYIGQIKLNCVLMQNWIVWNKTDFDIENVLTLNRIVWNRTIFTFNCLWPKTIIINWTVSIRTVWLNWIYWNRN